MSMDSNTYQIVILIDIKDLRNDPSYKRNVILGSLKLLTFYSAKARSERRQLQWGFAFFDESSFFSKALPSCKFRDFDVKNFSEFEGLLDKLSTANDDGKRRDPDRCTGCFDKFCECKKNAPAVVLSRCFTEILTAFAWDSPDISSPVKPTILKRLNDSSLSTFNGHKRRITKNSSFIVEKEVYTNAIVFFSKSPLSMDDLVKFTLNDKLDKSSMLLEEFMPSAIRKDFRCAKKIDLFWIDTHTKIYNADISGMCIMAEALSAVGKLLTLKILFGTRDLHLLMLGNTNDTKTSNSTACGKALPDSATLMHYLVTPSTQCLYYKDKTNASVHLYDKAGSQVAELCTDLITWNAACEIPHPVKMVLLGTLPLCAVPLACIQPQPVFGVREAAVSEQSVWSQLLSSLMKKCMVLVVENHCHGDPVPTVCLLQALTLTSASLTYLKSNTVIDMQKKYTFRSSEPVLTQSSVSELIKGHYVGFTKDSDHCDHISKKPADIIKFDPELLEVWLLPKALPSSLGTFLDTNKCGDLDTEDVDLLEQLQRTYMYHKSKRLTDVSSAHKKLAISLRRSPRKKCEQQMVRRSPRKAVRARAAMLARGPGSNQSLPELELHGRSATAPTRVDLIMQKSKQARYQSTDEAEKKPSRKSAEASSDLKNEEPDFDISCAEELFDHVTNLHKEALEGQRTPTAAMIRATALIASFTSKNNEVTAKELLKKSIWLSTAEVSKKYTQHTQEEKIKEFECQLVLWMEAISRGWLKDKDTDDEAIDEVVMILRRLSFLQDPGALNLQLADLLARYGDDQPSVLCTIYKELGHPLPSQLQGMFSPDDLDMTLDSQAPGSVLSFVDSVQRHSTRLQSNKQGSRKVMRHTSFHVLPQRQIKVAIPNKDKKDKIRKRRSARIASSTKVKPQHKHDDSAETKQVRRNLFSGGGAKLERCQSIAVMEAGILHKSATAGLKQKHRANQHRRSLVTETPAHKQRPNQTWQRQERWRRRTHTVTAEVTVIQESPDKKTIDTGKGSSQSGGVANFVRRASFYSGAPDKISRAIQKCEMLEARMTKRLLSPSMKSSGSRMLTAVTPRRRIQPTTLFSKLFDPSPCKPKPSGLQSPARLMRADSSQLRCADFSSPSKNTRGRMRLFQSPSPKRASSASKLVAVNSQETQNNFESKRDFMSPIKDVVFSSCFDSPSKNTRLQSRLQSVCQDRVVSSGSSRMLFQMSPSKSVDPLGRRSGSQTTPTKIKHLFQSPTHTRSTPRKSLLHHPSKETPTKQAITSESCIQGTPTRGHRALSSARTPRKTSVDIAEFSSPSKNTRSHSKIFKTLSLDAMMSNRRSECESSAVAVDTTTIASSLNASASHVGLFSSVMTSSQGEDVKIFASAAFTNASSSLNTAMSSSSLISPPTSSLLLTPSKSTRSQTRLFPSLSSNQSGGTHLQGITSSAPSTRNPVFNSTVSQRLFSSPAKQLTKPLIGVSFDDNNRQVSAALSSSPGERKMGHSSGNLSQRKRKLSFLSSPDKCQNTLSKRHRSSILSSSTVGASESSIDYFDCSEVFIEKSNDKAQEMSSINSSVTGKLSRPPPNPSVEQLRHHSAGSSIPSPVFSGLEKVFSDQSNSNSSPSSPVFESTTPQRQNKENCSDAAASSSKKGALSHFSPQLSRGSISQLVTSPMLSPSKHGRHHRRKDGMTSPDVQLSRPSQDACETSENRENNKPIINNQSASKGTPKSCKKSFCRMPTKLSL